jgi:hypothetical protein
VGLSGSCIEPAAVEVLSTASTGVSRGLCLLARAAWIAAATAKAQRISAGHVQAAIDQVPCVPGLVERSVGTSREPSMPRPEDRDQAEQKEQ